LDLGVKVLAVEIDKGLAKAMTDWPEVLSEKLLVVNRDILEIDCLDYPGRYTVCGNLPYNISSPVLFWFLKQGKNVGSGIFMLQKELVQRMVASPGGKDYGRLTVAMSLWFEIRCCFDVSAEAFQPRPKVDSSVVVLRPRENLPEVDANSLAKMTGAGFFARRKTIFNNLSRVYGAGVVSPVLKKLDIDPGQRPETICPGLWAALAANLEKKV
jgi:16S rRNA (adenine1518-N6/adenine1519-N6)-dimethyltransferase